MSKYIDVDLLKKEIERRRKFHDDAVIKFCNNRTIALTHSAGLKEDEELLSIIDSLQQEQPDFPTSDKECEEFLATHSEVEVPDKYKTPDWLWKKQEQPEVDLEEEVRKYCGSSFRFNYDEFNDSFYSNAFEFDDVVELARHFYELGLNARKEE